MSTDQRAVSPMSSLAVDHRESLPDRPQPSPRSSLNRPRDGEVGGTRSERVPSPDISSHGAGEYSSVPTDEKPADDVQPRNSNLGFATILADVTSIIFPVGVVVFTVLVFRLNGSEVGDNLRDWRSAINVFATLFPILYASVVGRLMFEFARWRLESGATLGFLEQLMGSRTVGSTVTTIFALRSLNILAIGLLLIWSISPIGAQAILRMLETQTQPIVEPTNITYFNNRALPESIFFRLPPSTSDDGNSHALFASLATLYTILISTPKDIKSETMDLWGNVKIPVLDSDSAEWKDIPDNSTDIQYYSLTGIPIRSTGAGNTTLSLESSHIHVDCPTANRFIYSPSAAQKWKDIKANVTGTGGLLSPTENGTWIGLDSNSTSSRDIPAQWSIAMNRWADDLWYPLWTEPNRSLDIFANETNIEAGPTELLLRINLPANTFQRTPNQIEITCSIKQQYVESNVSCSSTGSQRDCKVIAQRPSQKAHAPEDITQLSFFQEFIWVARELPIATGRPLSGMTDPSLFYLKDPTFESFSNGSSVGIQDIDERDVGPRFGQLLNTYVSLSQLSGSITNAGKNDAVALASNITTHEALSTTSTQIYVVSQLWIGLCFFSTCVLVIAGILGVVITHLTYGPETLGYVSTMIRHSKFVEIPRKTDWLDGSDLTNKLKGARLRFGYTRQDDAADPVLAVGHEQKTDRIKDFVVRK
ncbi:hypothetical protein CkaCkLH20_11437 [Colletotrichum karsti]|uniref:Uncharacterized protein n=1 Tax=Colletotrichum karsti TaxID=1095194 RepID=A0A9P6LFW8_9PEZI|nr:uncharacterized protein CkaCkLH20_11437 [Colletotrichum karsti]KAF9871020.1 hypothetical protein CkaCkLH20_11437 [Colletotrichum karsti]